MPDRAQIRNPESRERRRALLVRMVARACAWLGLLISATVLFGWAFDVSLLKNLVSESGGAKVNAALALGLCAIALQIYLQRLVHRPPISALILAASAALIGFATLAQYLLGINLGIDQILAVEVGGGSDNFPGRMAPNTAACLLVFATALAMIGGGPRFNRAANFGGFSLATVGILAAFGHLTGSFALGDGVAFADMALPEALAMALLGIGLLLSYPDDGIVSILTSDAPGGYVVRRLLPATLVLAPLLGFGVELLVSSGLIAEQMRTFVLVAVLIGLGGWAAVLLAEALNWADGERRKAEEQFRNAFENAPVGFLLVDAQGDIQQANGAAVELLGRGIQTLAGTPLRDYVDGEFELAIVEAVDGLLHGAGEMFDGEIRCVAVGGRRIWVSAAITVVHSARGRPAHLLVQLQDVTERRVYTEQLEFVAHHDPLTGLLNRASFESELTRFASGARPSPAAVIVCDLDGFKAYNDAFGHQAGDELLAAVAEQMRQALRTSDVLARLGGDEFAIVLNRVEAGEALAVAEKLVGSVRETPMRGIEAGVRPVTVSAGVALIEPGDGDLEAAVVNADLAMYEAKIDGRDRTKLHEDKGSPSLRADRVGWLERIREALAEEGRLQLYAQPVVTLRSARTACHAVELRMPTDSGETIGPGAFMPFAQRFGVSAELERWLIHRVIDLLPRSPLPLEINLSAASLAAPESIGLLSDRLTASGVAPRLKIAITELDLIENVALARKAIESLSELGVGFTLAGFGFGFGSLQFLDQLPFASLRIGGDYVQGARERSNDRLVVEMIVRVAREFRVDVVAERIADIETAELMRDLGVRYGQGYVLDRPVPIAEVVRGGRGPRRGPAAVARRIALPRGA